MPRLVTLSLIGLIAPFVRGQLVQFQTPLGNITMEMLPEDAPQTVENFLYYVRNGDYTQGMIHRLDKGFVIQGGQLRINDSQQLALVETLDPVVNEFNVSNVRGTVAMARVGGQVNSATSQWFINLKDNSFLDTVDEGFTVFARVLGNGMEVADAINDQMEVVRVSYGVNFSLNQQPLFPGWDADGSVAISEMLFVDRAIIVPHVTQEGIIEFGNEDRVIGIVSEEGRQYQLQTRESLTEGTWGDVGEIEAGTGTIIVWDLDVSETTQQLFFQVLDVTPQP